MSNLLSVVVRPCSCGGKLCFDQTITIDDINSELFVGGIFSFSGTPGNPKPIAYGCYEVRRLNLADSQANAVIVSEYTDCATCLVEASNALRFDICSGEKNTVYLPKTSFSPLPTVGDVFFLDVYIDNFKGGYARITSCFTFVGFVFIGPKLLNDYGLVSATPYVDCPTCLSGSPIINVVRECVSGDIYYIPFPSNLYSDHLVTFTGLDGITQFCGIVKEEVVNVVITGLLVADLGIIEKTTNDCNTCLTNVAEKKKLINCLDSEDIIIAWASQLFEAGDVTNISINNSCYLISPDPVDPEEPVTVPEFADFDPHQQCENCFECHGLTYDFSSCTESVFGKINSYEYIPIGDSFYHPISGICCTVTNIRTDMDGDFNFYSLKSYSGCSDCNEVSYEVFTVIGCDIPVTGLVVAEAGQYLIGDFVRSHWGNSNFLCFEIDGTYTIGDLAEDFIFETENEPSFSSCTECTLGATVGLTLINCNTRVESYVNVSLDAWSTIFGLNSLPNPSVCDAQGNCYVVVNSCPIDNVYEEFTPTNFYFDCTLCRVDNPGLAPRSANVETLVCVTCCPCDGTSGSTFSVVPPHPVWTDGYGTPVTQLNMITLGGINGLNG
jgi:hypothetical protein